MYYRSKIVKMRFLSDHGEGLLLWELEHRSSVKRLFFELRSGRDGLFVSGFPGLFPVGHWKGLLAAIHHLVH